MAKVFASGSVSKSKSKTTSDTTYDKNGTSTTTATAPDWITDAVRGITGNVTGLAGADPGSYVAGADPLQLKAGADATNLSTTPWNFDGALDMTRGVGSAAAPRTEYVDSSGMINRFQNPYLKDVVDSALADFDFGAGNTRAQQDLDLANSGAFGGSGAALTKSATEGELARGRASTSAGLRSAGFNTALGAAQADAARKQAANDLNAQLAGQGQDRSLASARQIADIAAQLGGENRANIATEAGVGATMRDIATSKAEAPLTLAAWARANLPPELAQFFGQDTTSTETGTENTKGTGKTSGFSFTAGAAGGKG